MNENIAMDQSTKSLLSEFVEFNFGDKRLNLRFAKICDAFNQTPQAIMNQAIRNFYDCKAAYRFWDNPKISVKKICDSHRKAIEEKIDPEEKFVLEIQDSTELNFSTHLKTMGLGPIASGKYHKGLEMHSSLLALPSGLPIGIASIRMWARDEINQKKGKNYRYVPWEEKESIKWVKALEDADEINYQKATRVLLADREADFFELLDKMKSEKRKMIIRLRWDRKVNEGEISVKSFLDQQSIVGEFKINIAGKRGPNFRKEKTTMIAVKYSRVDLMFTRTPKGKKNDSVPAIVVHAQEINPKVGEEPLQWYLITNLEVGCSEEAIRIVNWYSKRWLIEEFHKILKGGIKIEEIRLGSSEKLQKFITFLAVVSFRLLWISRVNRIDPKLPCQSVFSDIEWKIACKKAHRSKFKENYTPTIDEVVKAIAMLGGYFGRKNDGPPGVMTFWRGWSRLQEMLQTLEEFGVNA